MPFEPAVEASEMSKGTARVVAPSARRRIDVICIMMRMNGSGVGCVCWGRFCLYKRKRKSGFQSMQRKY